MKTHPDWPSYDTDGIGDAYSGIPIIADGFSCRQQILDGSGRTARHIALVLRDALTSAPEAITLEEM